MGKLVFWVMALGFAGSAFADALPTYLNKVTGVLVTSPTKRESFTFDPGALQKCDRQEGTDWVMYVCTLGPAPLTVSSDGSTPLQVTMNKVLISIYSTAEQDIQRKYEFMGTWQGSFKDTTIASPVQLTLSYFRSKPTELKGGLELVAFGNANGLVGTQVAPPQP